MAGLEGVVFPIDGVQVVAQSGLYLVVEQEKKDEFKMICMIMLICKLSM